MKNIRLFCILLTVVLAMACLCGCSASADNAFSKIEGKWADEDGYDYCYISSDGTGMETSQNWVFELHSVKDQTADSNTLTFIYIDFQDTAYIWTYDKTTDTIHADHSNTLHRSK